MSDDLRDVVICGAGPVGAACALFLRERGMAPDRIAIADARKRDEARGDDRMVAISHGSRTLLARIGAWHASTDHPGAERAATPIHAIHVSHRARYGRTVIAREDQGVPALGYVIRLGDLVDALDATLARAGLIVTRPARVEGVNVDGSNLRVELSSGALATLHAIHAEGGLFDRQARRAIHRDYQQTAVTTFVTLADPPAASVAHTAFERFTDAGPIALLPAREVTTNGTTRAGYSLVWCGRPDDAASRIAMTDVAFLQALHEAFGDRLGPFASCGPRRAYPLGLNAVDTVARARTASSAEFAIGNAAQTLHPVAGQGLNLGLRDAFTLATLLASGEPRNAEALVDRYIAERRSDRRSVLELTDFMPRVFASGLQPVAWARGLTLALLDVAPALRGIFARQMMDGRR